MTIRNLNKGDYIGFGGQGLIMNKDQFKGLFPPPPPQSLTNPYIFTPLLKQEDISFTHGADIRDDQIPQGYVVKLIANENAWITEMKELITASNDLFDVGGLPYFDATHPGGFITSMNPTRLVYGNGFFSASINMHRFYVIFMKQMSEVTPVTLVNKKQSENKNIWNTVLLPLIIQLNQYHKKGKVHRDIKHLNVMMFDNKANMIDFGLAMNIDDPGTRAQLLTNQEPTGTPAFISPWYYMLHAMYPHPPRTLVHDKPNTGVDWVFQRLLSKYPFYPSSRGYIGSKKSFFTLLGETKMLQYLNAKTLYKTKLDEVHDVGFFMRMNDWYALALTVEWLYNVQLPVFPPSLDSTYGFFSCFTPSVKKSFAENIKSFSSSIEWTANRDVWSELLKAMRACNTQKASVGNKVASERRQGGARLLPYGGGGVTKQNLANKSMSLRNVLGKNRKVYKIKGMGNVLYVKVMGKEMTLKDARALDAKQKQKQKQKQKH